MGQESHLQMSPEIVTCGPSPGLVRPAAVNLPDRTNRILLTAGGVHDRRCETASSNSRRWPKPMGIDTA